MCHRRLGGRGPCRRVTTLGAVTRLRLLAAAPVLVLALTGCDAITEASNTLNQAELCVRALEAAGFSPNLSDPAGSVRDAQAKAQELRDLAGQTDNADLQRELNETADRVGSLQESEVNPSDVVSWSNAKLSQYNELAGACGNVGGG